MFAKSVAKRPTIGLDPRGLIVILNGTSCAGKSTSKAALEKDLPAASWAYVECDLIEDRLKKKAVKDPETQARVEAIATAQQLALEGKNVIVDIILTDPCELKNLDPQALLLVLVYAPPAVLIERDKNRTQSLKSPLSAQAARRGFILSSFYELYETTSDEGLAVDCLDLGDCELSIPGATGSMRYLQTSIRDFREAFVEKGAVFIQPRFQHQQIIRTAGPQAEQDLSDLCVLIKKRSLCYDTEQKATPSHQP